MKYFYLVLKILVWSLVGVGAVFAVINFINGGGFNSFSDLQKETALILGIVCGASMVYCFVVGEITRNNSQMDKLWSILPPVYSWIIAIKGSMNIRLVVMAVLVTLWGARLTYNFAKKGAYSIKFWSGEEDYRWILLRTKPGFKNKFVWCIFDLLFISFFQNAVVLLITIPGLLCLESTASFGYLDVIFAVLVALAILYETIADKQQMAFQTEKYRMLKEGKTLEELPAPYNLGFNTTGLWNRSRHPNYIGEQSIWVFFYLFTIAAGCKNIFNFTALGALLLILIFAGSSTLAEGISSSKYPRYKDYQNQVFKYVPIKGFKM